MPLAIKDTNHPQLAGTVIGAGSRRCGAQRQGDQLAHAASPWSSMESVGMWQQVGFLADVFAQFKRMACRWI